MGWKIPGISIFPQESRRKFQNMPQIIPFQITLSLQVIRSQNTPDFHLALRQQRKKISDFFNSPQTLNLVIKLKFRKKSEISEKSEISKNLKFRKI